MITGKWFSKEVSKIVLEGNFLNYNIPRLYKVVDVVVSNINVFDLSMVLCILCKCSHSTVVPFDQARACILDIHLI